MLPPTSSDRKERVMKNLKNKWKCILGGVMVLPFVALILVNIFEVIYLKLDNPNYPILIIDNLIMLIVTALWVVFIKECLEEQGKRDKKT